MGNKVELHTRPYEISLNTLNYLLGKENIEEEAKKLFIQQPYLIEAIPSLIASRDRVIGVSVIIDDKIENFQVNFNKPNIDEVDNYIKFMKDIGLLDFMKNKISKNLVDFVYGVETELDSNARKNRSGESMETLLANYINFVIDKDDNFETLAQATAPSIKRLWDIDVPVDKSTRRFDGVIYDKRNHHIYIIETNYYGGGGSKLKAVCGEFSNLKHLLETNENVTFVWVTEGQGWHTTTKPLLEAFSNIDYIFNTEMLDRGYLKELIYR